MRKNQNFTFKVAANHFIDTDIAELHMRKTGKLLNRRMTETKEDAHTLNIPYIEDLPAQLDWRVKGALTMVKD